MTLAKVLCRVLLQYIPRQVPKTTAFAPLFLILIFCLNLDNFSVLYCVLLLIILQNMIRVFFRIPKNYKIQAKPKLYDRSKNKVA